MGTVHNTISGFVFFSTFIVALAVERQPFGHTSVILLVLLNCVARRVRECPLIYNSWYHQVFMPVWFITCRSRLLQKNDALPMILWQEMPSVSER